MLIKLPGTRFSHLIFYESLRFEIYVHEGHSEGRTKSYLSFAIYGIF